MLLLTSGMAWNKSFSSFKFHSSSCKVRRMDTTIGFQPVLHGSLGFTGKFGKENVGRWDGVP